MDRMDPYQSSEGRLIEEPCVLYKRRWFMLVIWLLNYVQMIGN